jgi:hypothetical protein
MIQDLKPSTKAFLLVLGLTFFVWVLRGLGLLSFLPGIVLWGLIGLTIVAAMISAWR